jgi:hypothetical protein
LCRNLEEAKGTAPSKRSAPRWCPRGITKTKRCRLQKIHQRELAEKREEEQQDLWFNRIRPMTKVKQTWCEKRLARKENGNNSGEEEVGVTSDKGESTSDVGNSNPDKGDDQQEERPTQMEINMVFTIPVGFCAPTEDVWS